VRTVGSISCRLLSWLSTAFVVVQTCLQGRILHCGVFDLYSQISYLPICRLLTFIPVSGLRKKHSAPTSMTFEDQMSRANANQADMFGNTDSVVKFVLEG
jgi:hypothetical protein